MGLRILIAADGTSIHTRRALDAHLARGCEVGLVGMHDAKPGGAPRYQFIPIFRPHGGSLLRMLIGKRGVTRFVNLAFAAWIRRLYRRFRPDVVHVYQVDQRAYYFAQAGGVPLVLSAWGSDINSHFQPGADPVRRRRIAEAVAAADMVVADAADILDKCRQLAGRDVPTTLLTLGVDTARFRPGYEAEVRRWRQELGIPEAARVLLAARSVLPNYQPDRILEAFHRALPRFRVPAVLLFKPFYLGEASAACEKALREQIAALGLQRQVGWVKGLPYERLPEVYNLADVVVSFPKMDAFPVTFLEAAACERAVLSCRLPAYQGTFVEDYFRLVEPGDVAALSDAMVAFVHEPASAHAAARAALRRRLQQDYDESVTADRLFAIYERLLSPGNAPADPGRSPVTAAGD